MAPFALRPKAAGVTVAKFSLNASRLSLYVPCLTSRLQFGA